MDKSEVSYTLIDITVDGDARDVCISLGYQQAPVVVTEDAHWSGFRPERIKDLATTAAAA